MSGVFEDPTFWVGVGTVLFVLVLIRQKVPGMVAKMLDDRAAAIKASATPWPLAVVSKI